MNTLRIFLALLGLATVSQAANAQFSELAVKYNQDTVTLYVGQKVKIFASSTGTSADQFAGCMAVGLPSGLQIDAATCAIIGTPLYASESLVRVRNRLNFESPLRIKVEATAVIFTKSIVEAYVGQDFEVRPQLIGIPQGQPAGCYGSVLPSGLTLDSVTCAIRGRFHYLGRFIGVVKTRYGQEIAVTFQVNDMEIVYPENELQLFVGQGANLVPKIFGLARSLNCFASGLPQGLRIDPTTCAITGIPLYASRALVVVRGTFIREIPIVINVASSGIVYSSKTFAVVSGRALNIAPQLIGIPLGQSPACTALNLPLGLRIDFNTCAISGTVMNSTGLNRQITVQSRFASPQALTLRDGN